MGEVKFRSFRAFDHARSLNCHPRATRCRKSVLCAVVFLVLGMLPPPSAHAQDDAPKVEAPASVPGAPAEISKSQGPAPPGAQQKDSAPAEKQKGAPTAPAETDKGAPTEPAEKQKGAPTEPAEKSKDAPSAPDDAEKKPAPAGTVADREAMLNAAQAVSAAYRFAERYGIEDNPTRPELITQYRVGMQHTAKFVREKAQGAPERSQWGRTMLYTERAAKVTRAGEPSDLIRRYDRVILSKELQPARPINPPFLEGLSIWHQRRLSAKPLLLSLTPGRTFREDEFSTITDEISIPQLIAFFPTGAKRVSETWEVPPVAVQHVSGELPDPTDFELTGTLNSVTKDTDGKTLIAEIGVTGRFRLANGPSAFNAQIEFAFEPTGVTVPGNAAAGTAKIIQAYGRIKRAMLSHALATDPPDTSSRLRTHILHELVLERRPLGLLPGERGTPVAPLVVPVPMPEATKDNSWVIFEHAERRFHFSHPQELRLQGQGVGQAALEIRFTDERPTGRAALSVLVPTKTSVSAGDGLAHDPASLKKQLDSQWAADGVVATKGQAEWLPDEDWKELKRRVYRFEASLKIEGRDRPIFADHYFVEFNRTQNILVFSWTERPDHVAYRTQAEDLIRSFQFGTADKSPVQQPASQPTSTAPGATPAQADAPGETPAAASGAPASTPAAPPR
jgi:hypothetical protein